MSKVLSIQALRGIAVLGVVGFHSLTIEHKYSGGDLLLPDFLRLGQLGVDLFFVISGFVMVTVTRGRFGRRGEMMRFFWGRLSRIYPTYWVYFFLTLGIYVLRPGWVNSSQGHQVHLLSSFFLFPSDRLPLVMVAWSLIHELWFYLVFTFLLKFPERFLVPALLVWGAVVASANQLLSIADLPAGAAIALHPYSLEFIIGALAAVFLSQSRIPQLSPRLAAILTALVLTVGMPAVNACNIVDKPLFLRAGVIGSLCALLVLAVVTLEKKNTIQIPPFLRSLGDISYTVYLSHILVLSAIGRMWQLLAPAPDSMLDNLAACCIMLAAVIGYGWAGYRVIEQPFLNVSHRLRRRWFDSGRSKPAVPAVNIEAA